jgi:hypothetical protein
MHCSLLYIHVTERRYRFLFNNQPDALFIQIYSVIKLYMFRADSILTLLESGHHNLHETYQCRLYSRRLLMMGKEVARNMWIFMTE